MSKLDDTTLNVQEVVDKPKVQKKVTHSSSDPLIDADKIRKIKQKMATDPGSLLDDQEGHRRIAEKMLQMEQELFDKPKAK